MNPSQVSVQRQGRVAVVRFGRGDGRNALSRALIAELIAVARSFEDDAETSAIVLTAEGANFSYGFDLGDAADAPGATEGAAAGTEGRPGLAQRRVQQSLGPRLCGAWAALEPVTLVALEGWCVGGGVALAAAMDLRVAAQGAHLYVPEIERGMNMSWQSIPRLVSLIGAPRTRRLTLLAERIDAARALEWQLVDELAPTGQAFTTALAMAERIAAMPPMQVRMCKEGINLAATALHQGVSAMDRDQFVLAQCSDDFEEGVRSFLEKRAPRFRGR
jgi:enoyl-CoA hydratase